MGKALYTVHVYVLNHHDINMTALSCLKFKLFTPQVFMHRLIFDTIYPVHFLQK
jgi:hypothetical protein